MVRHNEKQKKKQEHLKTKVLFEYLKEPLFGNDVRKHSKTERKPSSSVNIP